MSVDFTKIPIWKYAVFLHFAVRVLDKRAPNGDREHKNYWRAEVDCAVKGARGADFNCSRSACTLAQALGSRLMA